MGLNPVQGGLLLRLWTQNQNKPHYEVEQGTKP